jgi:hypothetical protein
MGIFHLYAIHSSDIRNEMEAHIKHCPAKASQSSDQDSIQRLVIWILWWTKWHWVKFSSTISVSLAISHPTAGSILIHHPELVK